MQRGCLSVENTNGSLLEASLIMGKQYNFSVASDNSVVGAGGEGGRGGGDFPPTCVPGSLGGVQPLDSGGALAVG